MTWLSLLTPPQAQQTQPLQHTYALGEGCRNPILAQPLAGENPTLRITARLMRDLSSGLRDGLKLVVPSHSGLDWRRTALQSLRDICTVLAEEMKIKDKKVPHTNKPLTDNEAVTFSQNTLQLRMSYLKSLFLRYVSPGGLNLSSCFLKRASFAPQRKCSPIKPLLCLLHGNTSILRWGWALSTWKKSIVLFQGGSKLPAA